MELEALVQEVGFLPFFTCGIPSFSIEEMTPRELWLNDEEEGPWEWKGPLIREGHVTYGKFFNKKAGYVSTEWLPHLINYRRTLQLAKDDDVAALDDVVLQTIISEGTATIKELRHLLGFAKGRGKRKATDLPDNNPMDGKISLEPILTRLMMELRIVISDFEYNLDRHGRPYGWGIARHTTPEVIYGHCLVECLPEESKEKMLQHLRNALPGATEKNLLKLIG